MRKHQESHDKEYLYRFEIYISLKDRNGRGIQPVKLNSIKNQILKKFGGLTRTSLWGNPVYEGFWKQSPKSDPVYDKNSIFTVLAPQTSDSVDFFMSKKEIWRRKLNYTKLLITFHELRTL